MNTQATIAQLTSAEAKWAQGIRQDLLDAPQPKFQPGDLVIMHSAQIQKDCKGVVIGTNYTYYWQPDADGFSYRAWEYFVQPLAFDHRAVNPVRHSEDELDEENAWEETLVLVDRANPVTEAI